MGTHFLTITVFSHRLPPNPLCNRLKYHWSYVIVFYMKFIRKRETSLSIGHNDPSNAHKCINRSRNKKGFFLRTINSQHKTKKSMYTLLPKLDNLKQKIERLRLLRLLLKVSESNSVRYDLFLFGYNFEQHHAFFAQKLNVHID